MNKRARMAENAHRGQGKSSACSADAPAHEDGRQMGNDRVHAKCRKHDSYCDDPKCRRAECRTDSHGMFGGNVRCIRNWAVSNIYCRERKSNQRDSAEH